MKNVFLYLFFSLFCMHQATSAFASDSNILLLAIKQNNCISFEAYPLSDINKNADLNVNYRTQHALGYINIENVNISNIECEPTFRGIIQMQSNDHKGDHQLCMDWLSFLALDVPENDIQYILVYPIQKNILDIGMPKENNTAESRFMLSALVNGQFFQGDLFFDTTIESLCGIILPSGILEDSPSINHFASFSTLQQQGIISNNDYKGENETNDDEFEFNELIDAVISDCNIEFVPKSALMTWIQGVGSSLLVKYINARDSILHAVTNIFTRKSL